jgi:hypothetical protein
LSIHFCSYILPPSHKECYFLPSQGQTISNLIKFIEKVLTFRGSHQGQTISILLWILIKHDGYCKVNDSD